ncbi:MAG: hypothetical protein LBI27_01020 [Clostridiales bacterium]|nr:hypothetical protein [Clostridiales bacterium]
MQKKRMAKLNLNTASRTVKKFFTALLAIILMISADFSVYATTDSIGSHNFTISVDGKVFKPWGYSTDWGVMYITLNDAAYMLAGTDSQFNIRETPDENWDFWVVRGEEYTPDGGGFQPIPERWLWFSPPFLFGEYNPEINYYWPTQSVFIGVDGEDEPETCVSVRVVTDENNHYFRASDLARLFGFELRYTNDISGEAGGEFVEGFDYIILTDVNTPVDLPPQTLEVARLLSRLFGHWVDSEHFLAEEINESVVWPAEFYVLHHGINEARQSVAHGVQGNSGDFWAWTTYWSYPVFSQDLGNGLAELTIGETARPAWNAGFDDKWEYWDWDTDNIFENSQKPRFYNHRIIVDTNQLEINELTLFIGDKPHTMYRTEYHVAYDGTPGVRHTAEPAENGGIILRYVLGGWALYGIIDHEILIYRSVKSGEPGELIFRKTIDNPYDRMLYEFTDTTAKPGHVYYYSMQSLRPEGGAPRHLTGWNAQLRVDTSEILGEAAPIPPKQNVSESAPPVQSVSESTPLSNILENEITEQPKSESENPEVPPRLRWAWLLAVPACFGAWLIYYVRQPR